MFKALIRVIHENEDDLPAQKKPDSYNGLPIRVPGIELKKAVNELGIKANVFIQILQTFFNNHEHFILDLEAAWDKRNRRQVITLVHSLKGSAAGIGAVELYTLAFDIEKLCQKETRLPSMEKAGLDVLENALTIVLASIKTLVSEQSTVLKEKPEHEFDLVKTCAILEQLAQALMFPVLGELEVLMEKLESVFGHPNDYPTDYPIGHVLMEELRNNILSHDHDLAKQTVKKMQSNIEGQQI